MPEKVLKKINARMLPQWKVCFWSALIVGGLAHIYKITSWLPNWDSLVFRYDAQNMIGLGRWFLPVVCSVSSFYDLPFLNGIIAIIFHALSAVCICKMFDVKEKITAFLIGGVIVSFPTVISIMMYNYVADGYSIAFFLSTIAALLMTRKRPRYILSAILIALSAGIYQAYITITIVLVLWKSLDWIVHCKASFREVLKKCTYMLLAGIGGMALYGLILKIVLGISSTSLLDYQGIQSTASMSGLDLWTSLYVIKETFIKCFFDLSEGMNIYVILNALILAVIGVYYLAYIWKNKIYRHPMNMILVLSMGAMMLIGAGALALLNADIDYHNLMLMGYVAFYLIFIVIYERRNLVGRWLVLVVSVLLIANQVVIANVSYHKAQMAYEKSYGVLIRLADRIEQTEGTEACRKILIIGQLENSEDYSVNLTPNITGITDGYILRADDETVGQSVVCSALNDYCEKHYEFVSGEEKIRMMQSEAVEKMNAWPHKDCVTVMDETIVVKLSNEGE